MAAEKQSLDWSMSVSMRRFHEEVLKGQEQAHGPDQYLSLQPLIMAAHCALVELMAKLCCSLLFQWLEAVHPQYQHLIQQMWKHFPMQGFWGYEAEDIPGSTGALLSPGQRLSSYRKGWKLALKKLTLSKSM